ncbi:hypothetical protein P3T76_003025 [Phytophthora citrophthora]|uniref:Uncharacterized protein n=1 Tax=Phytophthora citrophthora TaxID=4793 RepID=A0AAD9GWC0_9STRA|nr:hypothetical protein P3T76_003025 [Phytophthora citrophthora]
MPTSAAAVTLPKLDVFFEGGQHFEWPNPTEYTCLSFTCPNLPKAKFVGWWDLPLHKTAAFYETKDCTYKRNKFTFNTKSARTEVTGIHFFTGGSKPIRSIMLGRTEAAELEDQEKMKNGKKIKIKRICNLKKNKERVELNETVANLPYEADIIDDEGSDGLSANWSDALPGFSDASGTSP